MKKSSKFQASLTGITVLAATAFAAQGALVAHYKLDETSGNLADASGNSLTGTLQTFNSTANPNAWAYNQPSVPAGTYGEITVSPSTAASFGASFQGGDNDNRANFAIGSPAVIENLINAGTNGPGGNGGVGNMTVMGWINLDTASGNQRIFGTGTSGLGGWGFGTSGSNLIFTTFGGADRRGTGGLVVGTWYHIAATYDDNSLDFFVNGTSVGTTNGPDAGKFTEEIGTSFRVGASNNGVDQNFGRYDEVKVFDTVLTAAEIQSAAIPEPSTALLGALGALALLRRRS